MNTISTYINDSLSELRHVRWPTRQQAIRLSIVVIIFCAIAAAALGAVDYLFAKVLDFLIGLAI